MDGTILGGGTFTVGATVVPVLLNIPSGTDWMRVQNYTQTGLPGDTNANGINFWWQRGMPVGGGIVYYKHTSADNHLAGVDIFLNGGFTLVNDDNVYGQPQPFLSAPRAVSAVTNAMNPVVSTGDTSGLAVGSIIRLYGTAQTDVNGIDFAVGAVTANTSFRILTAGSGTGLANAPGVVGGAGTYRIVNYPPLFYPKSFVVTIASPSGAGRTLIGVSSPCGFVVGQKVRFKIPAYCLSVELNATPENNYQTFTVVDVLGSPDDNGVGTCAFTIATPGITVTSLHYPLASEMPGDFPVVSPVGEDTAAALVSAAPQLPKYFGAGSQIPNTNSGILSDSTVNTAQSGMLLGVGGDVQDLAEVVSGPAGNTAGDFVVWISGKSSFYNIF